MTKTIKIKLRAYGLQAVDHTPENPGLFMYSNGQLCLFYTKAAAEAIIKQNNALRPYPGMVGVTPLDLGEVEVEVEIDQIPANGCLHCSWEGERIYKLCGDCLARYIGAAMEKSHAK